MHKSCQSIILLLIVNINNVRLNFAMNRHIGIWRLHKVNGIPKRSNVPCFCHTNNHTTPTAKISSKISCTELFRILDNFSSILFKAPFVVKLRRVTKEVVKSQIASGRPSAKLSTVTV